MEVLFSSSSLPEISVSENPVFRELVRLCYKAAVRRWGLPIAQCVLAVAMLPAAFLFGALGVIPTIGTVLMGRFSDFALQAPYTAALVIASISVVSAFILCIVSAILLFQNPTASAVR